MRMKGPVYGWLLALLVFLTAAAARADTGSDWLAKLPPPPKNLAEAQKLCGENAPRPYVWEKFETERRAMDDKLNSAAKAKMSDPAYQQQLMQQAMSASMDPAGAMAAQQYAQYLASLGNSSPDARADSLFQPAYQDADGQVDAILKAGNARLKKCPMLNSEAGPYPAPACQKPIDADTTARKAAVTDKYLAAVNKNWPQYTASAKDYFQKLNVVPNGVDPNNYQVKLQQANLPLQELGTVKDMGRQSEDICNNAVGLATRYLGLDID